VKQAQLALQNFAAVKEDQASWLAGMVQELLEELHHY
jgi:hypothetical protein